MRYLLDESADYRLASRLTELGHYVSAVAREYPRALPERDVLALALRERRVLITNDLDFGSLIIRDELPHYGVVLFRLRTTRLAAKEARLDFVLRRYADQLNGFLTVTETRVRPHRARGTRSPAGN